MLLFLKFLDSVLCYSVDCLSTKPIQIILPLGRGFKAKETASLNTNVMVNIKYRLFRCCYIVIVSEGIKYD